MSGKEKAERKRGLKMSLDTKRGGEGMGCGGGWGQAVSLLLCHYDSVIYSSNTTIVLVWLCHSHLGV